MEIEPKVFTSTRYEPSWAIVRHRKNAVCSSTGIVLKSAVSKEDLKRISYQIIGNQGRILESQEKDFGAVPKMSFSYRVKKSSLSVEGVSIKIFGYSFQNVQVTSYQGPILNIIELT
jgi:hypothetical protein